jgi:hypothetical protein
MMFMLSLVFFMVIILLTGAAFSFVNKERRVGSLLLILTCIPVLLGLYAIHEFTHPKSMEMGTSLYHKEIIGLNLEQFEVKTNCVIPVKDAQIYVTNGWASVLLDATFYFPKDGSGVWIHLKDASLLPQHQTNGTIRSSLNIQ